MPGSEKTTVPVTLKTALGHMVILDGYAAIKLEVPVLTADAIGDHLGVMLAISQQTGVLKLPVLLDLGSVEWGDWEARICAAEMLRPEWNEKVAFLYHNPVQKMLTYFFTSASRLEFPWTITGDRDAAVDWLRSDETSPLPEMTGGSPRTDVDAIFNQVSMLIQGKDVGRPKLSEAMDMADGVKAGIAMLAQDMRKTFEERDRFTDEAAKHRGQLEDLVRARTEEVKNVNESLMKEIVYRKGTEEELRRTNMELQQFAAAVSHDIKAPLAIVMAGCETLARMVDNLEITAPELLTMAELVRRNAAKANTLIEDVLSLAKVGEVPSSIVEVKISQIVQRVTEESAELIEQRGATIETEGDLGVLRANETHMYQLFSNLIINAIEHNPRPSPSVTVKLESSGDEGNRYTVCDNGKGVSEADTEMIFFPFYSGKPGRTGLGLSTVQKIIGIYGGEVKASNREDAQGACFDFTLREFRRL